MTALEYGPADGVTKLLQERGWPVVGVFVGGCVERGIGSSFHAAAHTHTAKADAWNGWICVRSRRRVLGDGGNPTRLLLHEVAHTIAPRAGHRSEAFITALAQVGIRSDGYSRAGRERAAGKRARRK